MPKENKKAGLPSEAQRRRESIFDIAIEMLLIAVVFLAPVIFDRRIGIVFSLTKVTTIRIIVIAILTVWAIKLMLKQEHKFVRTPLDYPVLSYMLACTIATLTSVQVLTSFMGFYGRYEGLSTLYCYGLLFFITTNFIKTKEQIKRIMYTVMVACVCMSIYGVMQRMRLDPYAWGGVTTWANVIGTIGQPNFFAAYVDMGLIIGLSLLLNMKKFEKGSILDPNYVYDLVQRGGILICLFLFFTAILFTQSRGGSLGLIGGVSFFFILADRKLTLNKWRELAILLLLIAGLSIIQSLNPETSIFHKAGGEIERTVEMSERETPIVGYNATLSRLETWKSAYRIIADRPFFGIGQEVLKMVFPRYETNKFRFYEGFHVKQDRCHNEVCDMAVTRGVITLFIYVWMLGTFFYMGIRLIRSDYDPELKLFTAAFLGVSAAYFVQNQFSFGVVAITSLVWVMMGMTASIYVKTQPGQAKSVDISNMPWLVFAIALIFAVYLGYLSTIQFRADMHYKNGKSLADMRQMEYAVKEYETSLKISPYEGGTWTHFGIATLNLAQISQNNQLINKAIDVFGIANKVDPYNADNFYITGRAYYIISFYDSSVINKIIESEQNAIKIDPLYAEAYQIIGSMYERQGKNKEAAEMYEKTVEINPMLGDAISALSNIYFKLGEPEKVIEIFKGFLAKYPNNPIFQENLAAIYVRQNKINLALKIYEEMIKVNPKNVTALVNYGFMSAKSGDINKARDSFESAILVDPKSVDAHNGLGLVYLQTGQREKAKEEFSQSLMVDPNNQYAKQMMEKIK